MKDQNIDRDKLSDKVLLEAFEYVKDNNLYVPLFLYLGAIGIDESIFLTSDYTKDDIEAFYRVAVGLNKKLVDVVDFQIDNEKRGYKHSKQFINALRSMPHTCRKKSIVVSFTDDSVNFDIVASSEIVEKIIKDSKKDKSH